MGNTAATSELNSSITSSIGILNQSIQSCASPATNNQGIIISGCSPVNIHGVNFSQSSTVDLTCANKNTASNATQQQIQTNLSNAAQSINQALNLTGSSANAKAIVNSMQSIATNISSVYSQSCLPGIAQNQTINVTCPDGKGGSVSIDSVN